MDLAKKDEPKQPQVFINPELTWTSRRKTPTRKAACRFRNTIGGRPPAEVKVKYTDCKASSIDRGRRPARDLLQHEIDHLNGVLFIDHISKLKRDRVVKKFTKALKQAGKRAAE